MRVIDLNPLHLEARSQQADRQERETDGHTDESDNPQGLWWLAHTLLSELAGANRVVAAARGAEVSALMAASAVSLSV